MKRYFMVAERPGPRHKWFRHGDYGNLPGAAWKVYLVGPKTGGAFIDGEYELITNQRTAGWEVIVTPLPTDWSDDLPDQWKIDNP